MTARTIRLLHVEDDPAQRRIMAHHLAALDGLDFQVHYAESEASAVDQFERGGAELVIMDYHLKQGDGLSCLRSIRARDRIVPIIAVSGAATPEIAAELLEAGADDYLGKRGLSGGMLGRSVRESLARADALRRRIARLRGGDAGSDPPSRDGDA